MVGEERAVYIYVMDGIFVFGQEFRVWALLEEDRQHRHVLRGQVLMHYVQLDRVILPAYLKLLALELFSRTGT
jgi:hypothetical protein